MTNRDFTRERKLTFSGALLFMINLLRKSLSLEIINFIAHISNHKSCCSFTSSAFVQCRKKINPAVFMHLNQTLIDEFYTENEASVKLWKGFRLLAVDGSILDLPNTEELKNYYGHSQNQTDSKTVQARASVLYDVLNRYVIDGKLTPLSVGEKHSALAHLEHSKPNDLILYDRGYPSFGLIYAHFSGSIDFVIRARKDFNKVVTDFYSSGLKSKIVKIYPGEDKKIKDKPYDYNSFETVRLVRVSLPGEEDEVLITSLLDEKKYPTELFKSLYFQRWKVETFYDEFKNKLKVAHFSGYSKQTILQDFYTALFVSNIQTLIVEEINEELNQKTKTKYVYKVNNNLSYGFLKDRIVSLFFSKNNTDNTLAELKELFKKHLIPIRPNRTNQRHKDKYRTKQKPKVTKNQKDTL
jgi:Transposase DDE domain